ncbi:protein of unknown function [Nitrospira japonica]|uniref:Uncharacterized protein n=1 Tax=Nitrospira japonica TaxID=1325564 RepID=A0A1W1I5Z5_9BACT|nr:protein of unknown function [Nitrospira japonica]
MELRSIHGFTTSRRHLRLSPIVFIVSGGSLRVNPSADDRLTGYPKWRALGPYGKVCETLINETFLCAVPKTLPRLQAQRQPLGLQNMIACAAGGMACSTEPLRPSRRAVGNTSYPRLPCSCTPGRFSLESCRRFRS